MIKLGLLGYGKMGKTIEQLAVDQGFEIVWRINRSNAHERTDLLLLSADVIIEFSRPEAALDNVMACLKAGIPVISGTTGWTNELPVAQSFCIANGGAMLWSSNFSIGVNIFFALNRYLAGLMSERNEYLPSLEETHHIHKLDAPSGTALSLSSDLIAFAPRFERHQLVEQSGEPIPPGTIPITAIRMGEIPGTHAVHWKSPVDEITIEHRADSRAGFALGAIAAARWILGKKGVFTMRDVLNIQ